MLRTPWPLLLLLLGASGDPRATPAAARRVHASPAHAAAVRVAINDNRVAGGVLRGRVLTLRLVARTGTWYPDGDDAPGTVAPAFAEEGHEPQIPGPMVRVRAGTEVRATVRNAVPGATLTVHGLHTRGGAAPAVDEPIVLRPGETREVRLRLDAPGTYYYWGTTMGRVLDERVREDAQLTGAIVVDAADGPPPRDRVLVLGMWTDTSGRSFVVRTRMLTVINGRSWPHTERLEYAVGDTVTWRVINATADMHPMHLHGTYFGVDSRGDGLRDTVYAADRRDRAVTDLMKPGTTMRLTWSPERAGNWLFHCHLPIHFGPRGSLGMPPPPTADHARGGTNHALQGMNGLVMGVTVRPAANAPAPVVEQGGARRQLRLVIRPDSTASAAAPHFEFVLDDGGAPAAAAPGDHAAPALVLERGVPVSITVVNTLAEATAVHWHGIELESYYDGVAGFSGAAGRISPAIAPGDSFVARFAPPRSGTFIYHTHVDEERQEPAGLAGPLIVLDPGERRDPARDLTVVASSPRERPQPGAPIPRVAWLNGSATPAPFEWEAGVRYRVRFINMTTGIPGLRFDLSRDGVPVRWRLLAKDGADLPADRRTTRAARQPVSIGETVDVELAVEQPGDLRLTAHLGDGTLVATIPVHVGPAPGSP